MAYNIEEIGLMLSALLESSNMMQWINGVAYERNNGGTKAILFSPVPGLQGAIVQVYKYRWDANAGGPSDQLSGDWLKLPQAVRDACPPDDDLEEFGAHKGLKDWLTGRGLLLRFSPFRVIRYAQIGEDGAVEKWRFVGCLGSPRLLDAQPAPAAVADGDQEALALLREIGKLGVQAYGPEPWRDGMAAQAARWVSGKRVGSVDDLNREEAVKLRDALRRRVAKLAGEVQS